MQLTLDVLERIRISDLFPDEDDMQTRELCRDIGDKVVIKQDEAKAIELTLKMMPDRSRGWTWNAKKAKTKKVLFTRAEGQFLKRRVKELDEKKKIKDEQLDLFHKIQDAKLKDEAPKKRRG